MIKELERAFQAVCAYNGLCVPDNKNKEQYMVELVNLTDPYIHVVKETATRIYNNIMTRKIVPGDIQNKSTLITHSEAIFLNVHCQCKTLHELHTFVNGPFEG